MWIALIFALITSSLILVIASYLVPYAFEVHLFVLWVLGVVIFPVILFFALLVSTDIFYRSYDAEKPACRVLSTKDYVRQFYLYPEAVCFLVLNFAIISPLESIQGEPFESAWLTIFVTICITSFLTLKSAYMNPLNNIIGALNSKLILINDLDQVDLEFNTQDIKSQYKVNGMPRLGYALLTATLVVIVTIFMQLMDHWFYPFLLVAQCVWLATYLLIRHRMLLKTIQQVVRYDRSEQLQQGYVELIEPECVSL